MSCSINVCFIHERVWSFLAWKLARMLGQSVLGNRSLCLAACFRRWFKMTWLFLRIFRLRYVNELGSGVLRNHYIIKVLYLFVFFFYWIKFVPEKTRFCCGRCRAECRDFLRNVEGRQGMKTNKTILLSVSSWVWFPYILNSTSWANFSVSPTQFTKSS